MSQFNHIFEYDFNGVLLKPNLESEYVSVGQVLWKQDKSLEAVGKRECIHAKLSPSRARSDRDLRIAPDPRSVSSWLSSILDADSQTNTLPYPSSGGLAHVGAVALRCSDIESCTAYVYIPENGLVPLARIGVEESLANWASNHVIPYRAPWIIFLYSDIHLLSSRYSGNLLVASAVEVGCVLQLAYQKANYWNLALCASGAVRANTVEFFRDRGEDRSPRLAHHATLLVSGLKSE